MQPPPSFSKRILALDVLRAIAMLLILLCHTSWPVSSVWASWDQGSWVGVDIFFVLSGFLVSGLLFENPSPLRFYLRRGFKIYPAYWAMLLVTSFFAAAPLRVYLDNLFFLQNYTQPLWIHTWSLAVEEHFYLILPPILYFTPKDKLPRLTGMICAGVFLARCVTAMKMTAIPGFPVETQMRIDGLFFGVMLSYWYHYVPRYRKLASRFYWPLIVCGSVLFAPAFLFGPFNRYVYIFGMTGFYLGGGMVLSALVCGGLPVNPLTRTLGKIGYYSYSIYLWHLLFSDLVVAALVPKHSWAGVFLYWGLSIPVGIGMAKLIEIPFLKLRDACCRAAAPAVAKKACY
jgi:peptidoglycan/LPS O-acetylase OafA/YrhL